MENIYIIQTDSPSRLHYDGILFLSPKFQLSNTINSIVEGRHVYITSDEAIQDGEYGICLNLVKCGFKSHQAVFKMDDEQREAMIELGGQEKARVKKVVLTSDPSLERIQKVDDEFLKWLIKNPKNKFVSIKYYNRDCRGECGICDNTCGEWYDIKIPDSEKKDERLFSENDIINALHSAELKDNKDYSKIYDTMKEYLTNLKK